MRKEKLPKPNQIASRSKLSQDEADDILNRQADMIGEMFDSIVILATRIDQDGNTQTSSSYNGNRFAIRGLLEWANAEFEPVPREHIFGEDDDD